MKQWIMLAMVCGVMLSCSGQKTGEAQLTPEQENQLVDSVAVAQKMQIEEIGKSVDELQQEVDSLLHSKK